MDKRFVGLVAFAAAVTVCFYVDLPLGTLVTPGSQVLKTPQHKSWENVLSSRDQRQWNKLLEEGDSDLPYSTCSNMTANPPSRVFKEPPRGDSGNDTSLKKILFWNDNYVDKHFGFGFGREPFLVAGCPVNTCTTTGDRTRYPIEEVDALIWHFRSKDLSLPEKRSPHTRYTLWFKESPTYRSGDMRKYNNVFNWTLTYRLDSDIPQPYDTVYRRREPLPPTNKNYAKGKKKLAAMFVSHCQTASGREILVEKLQKRIQVDVFGDCGPYKCRKDQSQSCYKMVSENYKFYLSFENSLCRDYITEKFFNILRWDVVPVVFGSGNYSAQAPPHSYIDALSFPSVGALADHLLYLHHNDTAYNEYFKWKRFHEQCGYWIRNAQLFCTLCEMLHSDAPAKTYDLHQWYVVEGHCKDKESPDIKRFLSGAPPPHS